MYKLEKIGKATYKLPQEEGMRVPGLIIATEEILKEIDIEQPLHQVRNVAFLSGIVGYSIAMPDIHWGYGFPIGGVAAMDIDRGVISPGGVGYDINCGVRLAMVPEAFSSIFLGKELIIQIHYSACKSTVKLFGLNRRDFKPVGQINISPFFRNNEINSTNNSTGRRGNQFRFAVLPGRFARVINQVTVFIPIRKDIIISFGNPYFKLTGIV